MSCGPVLREVSAVNNSDHKDWRNPLTGKPIFEPGLAPGLTERINEITHAPAKQLPLSSASLDAHVTTAPESQDVKKVNQLQLKFPEQKIHDYAPPQRKTYSEQELAAKLTSQFYASVYYEAVFQIVDGLDERRQRVASNPEKQLHYIKNALDELHEINFFFRGLYKCIVEKKPLYNKFIPEIKKALGLIGRRVNTQFSLYGSLRRQINVERDHGNDHGT